MKRLATLALALALVLVMTGMVQAGGYDHGQNGSAGSVAIGAVAGGGGSIGYGGTSAGSFVDVSANSGVRNNSTHANFSAAGESYSRSYGHKAISGSIFLGVGGATAQTGGNNRR